MCHTPSVISCPCYVCQSGYHFNNVFWQKNTYERMPFLHSRHNQHYKSADDVNFDCSNRGTDITLGYQFCLEYYVCLWVCSI